jgi:nicotinate-nucleotide pyrophosphorylase (carboxylating)
MADRSPKHHRWTSGRKLGRDFRSGSQPDILEAWFDSIVAWPGAAVSRQFEQIIWDDRLRADWEQLLRLAVREDLGETGDRTTRALVPEDAVGRAAVIARQPGVIAGLPGVESTLRQIDPRLQWLPETEDGQVVGVPGTERRSAGGSGERIGRIEGPARGLLTAERLVLNLLSRLSGIATVTRQCVEAVRGTKAKIYDTRKTTPGWRRLEKYAVRQGGGWNHRTGLFDAVLIKDNHLALRAELCGGPASGYPAARSNPAEAVARARQFLQEHASHAACSAMIVEIEIDTLSQLDEVLSAGPDIVLLDNFSEAELREAVARRDARNKGVELEASGKVDLSSVRRIAETGVERISVGALTHSARWLDIGLDWEP